MLLLCTNLLTKSAAQAPAALPQGSGWRVHICADATGKGFGDNQLPTGPDEEPVLYSRAKATTPTLQTCFCSYSTIMATNRGPGLGPATLGPRWVPGSPQAHCSAPTPPTAVPVATCPHAHLAYLCHSHTHPIVPSNLAYKTSIKIKLLRILRQWQQGIRPGPEPL